MNITDITPDETENSDQFESRLLDMVGAAKTGENCYCVPGSIAGTSYSVRRVGRSDDGIANLWECDCPASKYRSGMCKHARLIADILNHVADEFGYE